MAGTENFSKSFPTKGMAPGELALMQVDLHAQELGKYGSVKAAAGANTGNFCAIQPESGGVTLASAVGENISWGSTVLSEGNTVYGDFTTVTVDTGNAVLYYSKTP